MPRSVLILAALLGLATLAGCANGDPVSTASESAEIVAGPSSTEPTAAPPTTSEPPAPEPVPAPAAKPAAAKPVAARPVAAAPTTVTPPGGADLTAVTDPKLGKLVTEANGMTVYFLTTDPTKPPASNCLDDCARLWPPVLLPASGTVSVNGIDAKLVGKLTRPDRSIQLTLAGRPLYRFIGDGKPGDTTGNGLAGTAFAISPTGPVSAGAGTVR